jgi:hypothetical protein
VPALNTELAFYLREILYSSFINIILMVIIIIIIIISLILETFLSSSFYLRIFVMCGRVWSLHVSARVGHNQVQKNTKIY